MVPSVQSILSSTGRTCSWELQIGDLSLRSAGPADTADLMAHLPEIEAMARRLGRGQGDANVAPVPAPPVPSVPLTAESAPVPASPVAAESSLESELPDTAIEQSLTNRDDNSDERQENFLNVNPASITQTGDDRPDAQVLTTLPNGKKALKSTQLSFLADLHMEKYTLADRRRSTVKCIRTVLDLFIAVVGDKRAEDVDFVDMETFAAALLRWPVRVHQIEDFKELDFQSILEKMKNEETVREPIELATCNKYIQHLSAWFNVIKGWGPREDNPVLFIDRKRFKTRHGQLGSRRAYRPPEIRRVFDRALMASYRAPHQYWTKLIGYYTGMRVTEVAQLYRSDVQYVTVTDAEGVTSDLLCLLIAETEPGQSVKSEYAVRTVPVPPQVLELGFERYLADLDRLGARHLFPGLPWGEAGPGGAISNWFNKELRTKVGITDPSLTLHCFRNHLVTLAAHNMVPEFVMDTLCGHSSLVGGGQSSGSKLRAVYRDGATPLQLFEYMRKLPYPKINVPAYDSAQFDHHLRHETARDRRNIELVKKGEPPMVRRGRVPKTIHADLLPYLPESADTSLATVARSISSTTT